MDQNRSETRPEVRFAASGKGFSVRRLRKHFVVGPECALALRIAAASSRAQFGALRTPDRKTTLT